MVATNTYTCEGIDWVIDRALLEVLAGRNPNIILLVRDMANTRHRVVFQNRMVEGNWYLESNRQVSSSDHLYVRFHYTGNDTKARWFRYDQMTGTTTWKRTHDDRVFAEITDLQAAMHAYGTEPPFRRTGHGARASTASPGSHDMVNIYNEPFWAADWSPLVQSPLTLNINCSLQSVSANWNQFLAQKNSYWTA